MGENILNRKKIIFFVSFFLYNLARVLPHAVLTIILINKGMTVGNIAIIQSFFMIACILFEFPSGILTDIWSEKIMYIISLILLFISYYIIMNSHSFLLLCVSWFIYGISSASISGSLETYFIRSYNNDEEEIKKFNVGFNKSNLYSTLIGGGIGSFIYQDIKNNIYTVSIILILISILIVLFFFKDSKKESNNRINIVGIFNDIKYVIKDKGFLLTIGLISIFQIIMQIFFQFWQVMMINIGFSQKFFGIFYIIFQIFAIFSNNLFKKIDLNSHKGILVLLIASTFIIMNVINNKFVFIIFLVMFLIPFNLYNNQLNLEIQKDAPNKSVSSVVSLTGTFCSIVSVIFLWVVGIMDSLISFKNASLIFIFTFMIISILMLTLKLTILKK